MPVLMLAEKVVQRRRVFVPWQTHRKTIPEEFLLPKNLIPFIKTLFGAQLILLKVPLPRLPNLLPSLT